LVFLCAFIFNAFLVPVFFAAMPGMGGPKQVVTMKVAERDMAINSRTAGRVDFVSAAVATEVEGIVEKHNLQIGKFVAKGELLAELNSDFLKKDLQTIAENISELQAVIERNASDLKRFSQLLEGNATTQEAYESHFFTQKELEARHRGLLVKKARYELELQKQQICAPFDGIIMERFVEPGEWMSKGGAIARLASTAEVYVAVPAPENAVVFLKSGMELSLFIDPLQKKLTGRIEESYMEADTRTKNYVVRLRIPYQEGLLQNMTVTVDLPLSAPRKMKVLRRDALVKHGGQEFVYTIKEGKAAILPVNVLTIEGDFLGCDDESIQLGMEIIVEGNDRLPPDTPVQVIRTVE
jgi:RND family efflux transporter MFP subunit